MSFLFGCPCRLPSVPSLNSLSLFCSPSFSPCSSRVHTPIRLRFASGRFPTAAPSATSGRTTRICISTWLNTIRLVLWMRWSASRLGTVNLSTQLTSAWELLYLRGWFCLQTGHTLKNTWKQTLKKKTVLHTENRPHGAQHRLLLKCCSNCAQCFCHWR